MNLDDWLSSHEDILQSFWRHAADADLCIVDGVAGLIDGRWDRWVPKSIERTTAAGSGRWTDVLAIQQSQHTVASSDLCGMHTSSDFVCA